MHTEIPWPHEATELNNDGMINLHDIHYQTKQNSSFFFESDLINDDSSFCLQILVITDLQCHVFPLKIFY